MMQARCQSCGWLFTLSQEAVARAVAEAQAKNEEYHAIACPQCGSAIRLEVAEMRRRLPADYALPEAPEAPVSFAPEAVSFSVSGGPAQEQAPPPAASREPVIAQAAKTLANNIAVIPRWDPQKKRQITQLAFRLSIVGVAAAWLITLIWLFTQPLAEAEATPLKVGANLTIVLAPVLAAAAGVERFLETVFSVIEHNWRTLVAYLGCGLRWLRDVETEVQEARKWMAEVSVASSKILEQNSITPEQLQALIPDQIDRGKTLAEWQAQAQERLDVVKNMMDMAQARLADAERELAAITDSDGYKNAKRAASIVLGLWLGLIVAAIGQLQMFAMLGVGAVPSHIDVLITGLVIGSGSYPVHSLVGLLQQAKDTLDSTQGYLKDKSEQVRKLVGDKGRTAATRLSTGG